MLREAESWALTRTARCGCKGKVPEGNDQSYSSELMNDKKAEEPCCRYGENASG